MNGNLKWIFTISSGIIVVLVTGWLLTTSAEVKMTSTNVAVLQAQYTQIKCDITDIKDLVREIRNDQVKRERNNK